MESVKQEYIEVDVKKVPMVKEANISTGANDENTKEKLVEKLLREYYETQSSTVTSNQERKRKFMDSNVGLTDPGKKKVKLVSVKEVTFTLDLDEDNSENVKESVADMKVLQLEEALKAEREKSKNLQNLLNKSLKGVEKWKSMFEEVSSIPKIAEAESTQCKQKQELESMMLNKRNLADKETVQEANHMNDKITPGDFDSLPSELWIKILDNLHPRDLSTLNSMYECEACNETMGEKVWSRHKKQPHPNECLEQGCGLRFTSGRLLKTHMGNKHPKSKSSSPKPVSKRRSSTKSLQEDVKPKAPSPKPQTVSKRRHV